MPYIALVGFGNRSPVVLGADPPVTSVDMCLEDAGGVAAEHLLLAISGQPTHGVHTVPCRLVARGSAAPGPPWAASPGHGAGPAGPAPAQRS